MSLGTVLFSFSGRLNRLPWWLSAIGLAVAQWVLLFVLMKALGVEMVETTTATSYSVQADMSTMSPAAMTVFGIVGLVFLWPGLAIAIKRWHDRGKSGWWVLIILIPIVGVIWALVENGFLRGTVGPNQYGPDPLGA
ncbi:DUF805 domain-containing protein [Oleomonas cavernae]|uniref:DUF805 domain-containing protein n=1 Tax=Oleomonas cavernae TaxID=2320859 RepID=A0A418WCG4_9PROT|nr:DUF805 domain-containing protein [Oleomonas cavernae]RJF87715.1 DUF805 domain-containing protein [Oleomonas cavernae]